jgi:hypothetical protein
MLAAVAGAIRALLEAEASPGAVRKSKEQLVLLCQSYMAAATAKQSNVASSRQRGLAAVTKQVL